MTDHCRICGSRDKDAEQRYCSTCTHAVKPRTPVEMVDGMHYEPSPFLGVLRVAEAVRKILGRAS